MDVLLRHFLAAASLLRDSGLSVGRSVGRGGVTDDDDDDDDSLPFHFIPFDLADTHTKKEKKKIYIEESYTPYGSPAL